MKKLIFVALLLVAAVGVVLWQVNVRRGELADASGGAGRPGGRMAGGATPVAVAPINRSTVRDLQLFTGTLLPREQSVVSPKIAGRLEQLTVDIGDRVTSGQLVAVLDDDEYARQVEMAQAELEVAQANVEETISNRGLIAKELERVQTLRQSKVASEADLDVALSQARSVEARHRVALAQVDQRKAALRAAEIRRSYTRIAPEWTNGADVRVVGERFVNQSDMLRAHDPIVTLLDVSVMTAVVAVTERNYPRIHLGQVVSVQADALGDQTFQGRVVRIAPVVRERSRDARVEIEIDNAESLLVPGMFVRTEVEFARRDDALVVPTEAVVRRQEQQGVFIADADSGTARFVPLKLGIVEREMVEVLEPADLSGHVVVLGQHLLEDGGKIIIPAAANPDGASGNSGKEPASKPSGAGKPPADKQNTGEPDQNSEDSAPADAAPPAITAAPLGHLSQSARQLAASADASPAAHERGARQ